MFNVRSGLQEPPRVRVLQMRGAGPNLRADVTGWMDNEITAALRQIALDETTEIVEAGNPYSWKLVDRFRGRRIEQARRRVEVFFGQSVTRAMLAVVEQALFRAINRLTKRRTGRLANPSNWQWTHYRGSTKQTPSRFPIPFRSSDLLIYSPVGVPHSTAANYQISTTRKRRRAERGRNPKTVRAQAKSIGFLQTAAASAQRAGVFRNFRVFAIYDPKKNVPGELLKATGSIGITTGGRRARRR